MSRLPTCKFFAQGYCQWGAPCRFAHDESAAQDADAAKQALLQKMERLQAEMVKMKQQQPQHQRAAASGSASDAAPPVDAPATKATSSSSAVQKPLLGKQPPPTQPPSTHQPPAKRSPTPKPSPAKRPCTATYSCGGGGDAEESASPAPVRKAARSDANGVPLASAGAGVDDSCPSATSCSSPLPAAICPSPSLERTRASATGGGHEEHKKAEEEEGSSNGGLPRALPQELRGAALDWVAARILSRGSVHSVLFVDTENVGDFWLEVASGFASRPGQLFRDDVFVWLFVPAGFKTRLYAARPLRPLFEEARVAYSVCNTLDAKGCTVPDALDAFLASAMDLLGEIAPRSVDFYIISADRALGPMRSAAVRHGASRAVKRVSRESVRTQNELFTTMSAPAPRRTSDLQCGLGELWEDLRGCSDLVEGEELQRSAKRFKKRRADEHKAKSLSFLLR